MLKSYVKISLVGLALALAACSHRVSLSTSRQSAESGVIERTQSAPGVVQYSWEEPMVDSVDVPPGLDPEGHYYRPAHQEIVEIRQGRWKYHAPNAQ